jgi:hypothetical protein
VTGLRIVVLENRESHGSQLADADDCEDLVQMDEFKLCAHDLRLQPGNLSGQRLGFLLGSRLQLFPPAVELCLLLLSYSLPLSIQLLSPAVFEVIGQMVLDNHTEPGAGSRHDGVDSRKRSARNARVLHNRGPHQ